MTAYPGCAGLARSPFVLTEHIFSDKLCFEMMNINDYWRASEASETLSGVYKFELVRYIYIYMYGGTYAILVAHATHM